MASVWPLSNIWIQVQKNHFVHTNTDIVVNSHWNMFISKLTENWDFSKIIKTSESEKLTFQVAVQFSEISFSQNKVFYLIPIVSLLGSVILAFHAYFLIFSRHYSEYLENKINNLLDSETLITHKLENRYFFPINDKKIVVAKLGRDFSWFSFVTLFITFYGIIVYSYGMYLVYNEKDLNILYPFSLRQITWASIDSAVIFTSIVLICSKSLSLIVLV